jgi:ABC-type polysaccharide/polyol phosphate transport system ATPase subunit
MSTAIRIENLSKQYRLGQVGTGTVSHDLNRWWARFRGKEDPYGTVGQVNQRSAAAEGSYVWALRDINLDVQQGEILGIIGANGAGKSTLLKLISRITSPTTGSIKAKGRVASLLEVGTGMHPEMTARENIYLNGVILGMRHHEITRKFDEIIEFAGCRMYVDTPIKRFSSGMQVRLAFAVAAFLEPEILIVDEVLAVGDAEFQSRALGKMQEVSSEGGRTILFVSHNLDSVRRLCSSAVILGQGMITDSGDTDAMVHEYLKSTVSRETCKVEARAGMCQELALTVNGKSAETVHIWHVDDPLELTMDVRFREDVRCPRLDLSFYRQDGLRLLTLRTDKLIDQSSQVVRSDWCLKIRIPNSCIHGCEGYLDIGISEDGTREYSLIYKYVWSFRTVSDSMDGLLPGSVVGVRATASVSDTP